MRAPLVSPTALTLAERVSRELGREVWVKHDDATNALYGGNKVRKLEHLIADALSKKATHVVTVGAAGSHHVLATGVHAGGAGLRVEAVLLPQPRTPHVEENLRADIARGVVIHPAKWSWEVPVRIAARAVALRARGGVPYVIPPGGSSVVGTRGYVDAMAELRAQMDRDRVGDFHAMVCALGSGATLAGIVAGQRVHGVKGEAWGVRVTPRVVSSERLVAWLARRVLAASDGVESGVTHRDIRVMELPGDPGYGAPMPEAMAAMELFAKDDVTLDVTYTARAAAGLVALARRSPRGARYLFWHTLSSAPMAPLLGDLTAPLPRAIDALMT